MPHIRIQTLTGHARFTLVRGHLLVTFYNRYHQVIDGMSFRVSYPLEIYNDGWNMKILQKVIRDYEPKEPKRVRGIYQ